MKILQVANSFKYAWSSGGVARVAYDISLALTKRGHKVTVFTTDKGLEESSCLKTNDPISLDGMQVYYFRNLSRRLARKGFAMPFYSLYAARRRLAEFDVIHIHELTRMINVVIYYYAKKYDIPYVFQAHGSIPRSKSRPKQILSWIFDILFGYKLLKGASKVIALTQTEAQQYRSVGVPKEKIETVPNGIDLSKYTDLPTKGCFKKKLGIDEGKKVILYLGRINRIKGIDFLVRAYAHLIRNLNLDSKLLIIGPDDGCLAEIQTLIKTLKMQDDALVLGPLYGEDKLEAYVDANVYVLASRYETFPMTVLEAMACGTPIILSEKCGLSEVVRNRTGLVVNPSSADIEKALRRVLTDEKLQQTYRENCKRTIEQFDLSRTVSKLERIYQDIVYS